VGTALFENTGATGITAFDAYPGARPGNAESGAGARAAGRAFERKRGFHYEMEGPVGFDDNGEVLGEIGCVTRGGIVGGAGDVEDSFSVVDQRVHPNFLSAGTAMV